MIAYTFIAFTDQPHCPIGCEHVNKRVFEKISLKRMKTFSENFLCQIGEKTVNKRESFREFFHLHERNLFEDSFTHMLTADGAMGLICEGYFTVCPKSNVSELLTLDFLFADRFKKFFFSCTHNFVTSLVTDYQKRAFVISNLIRMQSLTIPPFLCQCTQKYKNIYR